MKRITCFFLALHLVLISAIVHSSDTGFIDTNAHWAKKDIAFMAQEGLINGVGNQVFEPDAYITRAEFVSVAVRIARLENKHYTEEISDVNSNDYDWYAQMLQSALDADLIPYDMISEGFFPDRYITREEIAAILVAVYEYVLVEEIEGIDIQSYTDSESISGWAYGAMEKAIGIGILRGVTSTYIRASAPATRAQAVMMLKRTYDRIYNSGGTDRIDEENQGVPRGTMTITEKPEGDIDIKQRFPLYQAAFVESMQYKSGFYILADFETPPKEVYVKYIAIGTPSQYLKFKPVQYVVVYDPNGTAVASYDFSDLKYNETEEIIIKLNESKRGVWRIAAFGGNTNDRIEIGLPNTETWGISGINKLGITETTPQDLYFYIPRTAKSIMLVGYGNPEVELFGANGASVGKPVYNNTSRRSELMIADGITESVWMVRQTSQTGKVIGLADIPGVFCPTKEAAETLKGGVIEAEGLLVHGPIQARARKLMMDIDPEDCEVTLDWPEPSVAATVENPHLESLMYSVYGGLTTIRYAFDNQLLDKESPFYGFFIPRSLEQPPSESWHDFTYQVCYNQSETANMAALLTIPTELNVAYNNEAILNRTILSALAVITSMSANNILQDGTFMKNDYILGNFFFKYGSMAEGYHYLKELLPKEVADVWRDGIIAVGDAISNFPSYQPNQFANIMLGHMNIYLATGEERYLKRFEVMIESYMDYREGNKMSQHPAGYFMEELGPDGNYETMNLECHIPNYYDYKSLPNAKPELVEKIRRSIERSLYFQSFYWLPQTDGYVTSPNSINTRTLTVLANEGHPGAYAAYPEFSLAAGRYAMNAYPQDGLGTGKILSYIANTEQWQRNIIRWGLESKGDGHDGSRTALNGIWAKWLYKTYSLPNKVEAEMLPIEHENGTWELDGQIAFKRGNLYMLIFYSGDRNNSRSSRSGAPISVWTKGTGNAILSMKNNVANNVPVDDIINSTIVANGKASNDEMGTLKWIEQDRIFEISSYSKDLECDILWRYELDKDSVKLTVSIQSSKSVENAYLNLPIYYYENSLKTTAPSNGKFVFDVNGSAIEISWPSGLNTTLSRPVEEPRNKKEIRSLRIPLPSYGNPLEVTFRAVK